MRIRNWQLEIRNWKLEIGNLLFIVLLFSFFFHPPVFAQTPTIDITPTITETTSTTPDVEQNPSSELTLWQKFWNWLFGLFVKTDYSISVRPLSEINSDMTDYGNKNDADFTEKHSFAGSRATDSMAQTCFKGNVIKKVILNTSGYPDSLLSQICISPNNNICSIQPLNSSTENLINCQDIWISNLAHYFVQLQQEFYCFSDKNQLTTIESEIINLVNQKFTEPISTEKIPCYQHIYQDLYLTPKETSDNNEENTKKMIQTPISNQDQKSDANSRELIDQLNQNFIPEGSNWNGLNSLRPQGW